ncbi:MAG: beta galactosidase jelly roll domain-containing protein, partial [Clostridia bacterium]|nr:beta galactosidase jelly roll domain-containing protein [Clostridia bacterium]
MKRLFFVFLFAILLALIAFPAMADDASPEWEAILPESYETSGWCYPVVYVLPGDASSMDESGLARAFMDAPGLDVIVVRMALPEGAEAMEVLHRVIEQADAAYRTIPDAAHRIAAGTGAGGYLAYIAAMEEGSLFGSAVSIRGDLASEENPWLKEYGQVRDLMRQKRRQVPDFFEKTYTYLDAPADDPWTDLPGSTDDIGSLMIGWGIGSSSHEFTVRPGTFDEAFLAESAARAKDRISGFMLSGALEGELRPESTALAPDERIVQAGCSVTIGERLLTHAPEGLEVTVNIVLCDPETGAVLGSAGVPHSLGTAGTVEGTIAIEVPEGITAARLCLRVSLFGAEEELASVPIICGRGASLEGDILSLDLSGDWHFHYAGTREALDLGSLTAQDWQDWPVVQPGLANWTKGFGNISDANVTSGYGADYFDYFITGNGYYAREFTLPEGAAGLDTVLSIGYIDDRCEVYVNGVRIGATGMDEAGQSTGETTWAQYSCFDVPEGVLTDGGMNTVVVHAWNDLPFGAGGWYAGPIGLYSRAAFEAMQGTQAGFLEESFESAYAASAGSMKGKAEVKYLVLLPESYETSDRSYPTLYLLHQFNSDHTSYRTDGVDQLILEGAREGLFDEMIIIVPNSSEQSWWRGDWEKMVTEELIPHIDGKYRTVRDARYRFTAGCSMGGQGA